MINFGRQIINFGRPTNNKSNRIELFEQSYLYFLYLYLYSNFIPF
jgi:hypothetical protein